jgi:hypothetical protein
MFSAPTGLANDASSVLIPPRNRRFHGTASSSVIVTVPELPCAVMSTVEPDSRADTDIAVDCVSYKWPPRSAERTCTVDAPFTSSRVYVPCAVAVGPRRT